MSLAAKVQITNHFKSIRADWKAEVEKRLDVGAVALQTEIVKSLKTSNQKGMNPSPPGQPPHAGIGNLEKSIYVEKPREMTRHVGSRLPYARIQEFGGTISPGRWMPVPVSPEAKRHRTLGGRVSEFKHPLRPVKAGPGKIWLVQERRGGRTAGRRTVLHYVLVKSVYLPPRPYLKRAAHSQEFRDKLSRAFAVKTR